VICSFASSEMLFSAQAPATDPKFIERSFGGSQLTGRTRTTCPRSLVRPNSGPCQPELPEPEPRSSLLSQSLADPPPCASSCAACSSYGDSVTAFQSRTNSTPTPGHPILLRHAAWLGTSRLSDPISSSSDPEPASGSSLGTSRCACSLSHRGVLHASHLPVLVPAWPTLPPQSRQAISRPTTHNAQRTTHDSASKRDLTRSTYDSAPITPNPGLPRWDCGMA
jgi:hypothetical protein